MWSQNRDHILDLLTHGPSIGPYFGPYIGPQFGPYAYVQILVPIYRSIFWTLIKVQILDLGLKVLILQEGPHRSMKNYIGTMVMFYIMQNMAMDLLGSLMDHTFYGPYKGPRFGPKIKGPECGPRIGTKIWSLIMGPFLDLL